MYNILWSILPTIQLRIAAATILLLAVTIVLITKLEKENWIIQILSTSTALAKRIYIVIFSLASTIISWELARNYWYDETFTFYFNDPHNTFIICLLFTISLFVVVLIMNDVIKNIVYFPYISKSDVLLDIVRISVFIIISQLELGKLSRMQNLTNGGYDEIRTLSGTIVFLIINIFVYYSVDTYRALKEYEKNIAIIDIQGQLELNRYECAHRTYEENEKIIHDIRKHLNVLESLITEDKTAAAVYDRQINEQLSKLSVGFTCDNSIVSAIMSQKISEAESKKIHVHVDMTEVSLDKIRSIDLTSILSNLWDNAIEATSSKYLDNPYINVIIGMKNDFAVILFENPYAGILSYQNNHLVSKKGVHHGYGLKIIENAVSKYGGSFQTSTKDNIFSAKVIIPV